MNFSKTKDLLSPIILINLLISFFPLAFVIGTSFINLTTFLIILLGLKLYGLSIFELKKNKVYFFIICSFFIYIILVSIINYLPVLDQNDLNKDRLIKSFLFLRYLVLFLIIRKMVSENHFFSQYLFVSSSIVTIIVGCDLILQFYTGSNILGFTSEFSRHHPGLFIDEPVAGHFLQRFSPIVLFYMSFFYFKKSFKRGDLIFLSISVFFILTIFISGNRMPLILFFLNLFLILYFFKNLRKVLIIFFGIVISSYYIYFNNISDDNPWRYHMGNLKAHSYELIFKKDSLSIKDNITKNRSWHLSTYRAAINTWNKNKIFGAGLKSFRTNCEWKKYIMCNMHPHNYYLEMLTDLGLMGFVFLIIIFFYPIFIFLKKMRTKNYFLNNDNFKFFPLFVIFFCEVFPIRTSGSFFTTSNSTILFLMLGILIGEIYKKKLKK
tara:strand:- start:4885 stop:6195 length:1311 start_codon:yes stop_codon:yes gene_type:complete